MQPWWGRYVTGIGFEDSKTSGHPQCSLPPACVRGVTSLFKSPFSGPEVRSKFKWGQGYAHLSSSNGGVVPPTPDPPLSAFPMAGASFLLPV